MVQSVVTMDLYGRIAYYAQGFNVIVAKPVSLYFTNYFMITSKKSLQKSICINGGQGCHVDEGQEITNSNWT